MTIQTFVAWPTNRLVSSSQRAAALAARAILGLTACGSDLTSAGELAGGAEPGSSAGASGWPAPRGSFSLRAQRPGQRHQRSHRQLQRRMRRQGTIEYKLTGSGAGIKSFYNGLVDFAGSDSYSRPSRPTVSSKLTKLRNAARTTRPGTCQWWSDRSRSHITLRASTNSC